MNLTDNQIKNIHNLDTDTCIKILLECVERLGLSSVDEYSKVMCISKRNTYLKIKENKIKSIKINEIILAIIND